MKSSGLTRPYTASINAVIKMDCRESPHCVYNENVALSLAQLFNAPIAGGALVAVGDGVAYASLQIGMPGISLPDISQYQYEYAAKIYPNQAAALVAFDIFIGNVDRARNIKASLKSFEHHPLFLAFDHSHALLNIEQTASASIRRLRDIDDLIVVHHPFYRYVNQPDIVKWVRRISELNPDLIDECCRHGKPFKTVSTRVQASLANALKERAKAMPSLVTSNSHHILKR